MSPFFQLYELFKTAFARTGMRAPLKKNPMYVAYFLIPDKCSFLAKKLIDLNFQNRFSKFFRFGGYFLFNIRLDFAPHGFDTVPSLGFVNILIVAYVCPLSGLLIKNQVDLMVTCDYITSK